MAKCERCGVEFDADDVYTNTYMVDGIEYNFMELFDYNERTLCEDCALDYVIATCAAGEAYEWSLETGLPQEDYWSS